MTDEKRAIQDGDIETEFLGLQGPTRATDDDAADADADDADAFDDSDDSDDSDDADSDDAEVDDDAADPGGPLRA